MNLNTKDTNDLLDVLEQEAKAYEDILKISESKTDIIVEGKVAELENIMKLEHSLLLHLARLENQRELLMDRFARDTGMKSEDITITYLAETSPGENGLKLKAMQERIGKTLKGVRSSNDLNSRLIKNSLDFINFSLNLYVSGDDTGNNYDVSGERPAGKSKSFFDTKI